MADLLDAAHDLPVLGLPAEGWSIAGDDLFLFSLPAIAVTYGWSGLRLPGLRRFLALERYLPWWLRPAWGEREEQVPAAECQMLLWQREDGRWGVLLPTTHGNRRAWFQGGEGGLALRLRGAAHTDEPERLCLAVCGLGDDPAALVAAAASAAMARLRTARPRTAKALPSWVDNFGWCTWDAFHHSVSAEKIRDGLAAFAADGLSVPLLLIDDGWQQYRDNQLLSFASDPVKFPDGLAAVTTEAKERFGVRLVGVWHALAGYWNGVHPEGKLAGRYRLCPSFHGSYNFPGGTDLHRSLVHPDDAARFFHDLHGGLAAAGIDMVKIDNQASLDHFSERMLPEVLTTATYQHAVQGSAAVHFGNNLLHCMAMSGDVAWNLGSGAVWRNSDDYFPLKPESHGFHIVANAANALWTSAFALPDWDMFHSGHPAGWFHGAARAISGGPVYISDVPGRHDAALIRALTLSDGRVARPPAPARVADSRILVDCLNADRLLLVRNRCAAGFLLGAFHCRQQAPPITDRWSPADAGATGEVVVHSFRSGRCEAMDAHAVRELELPVQGWDIFTIVPLIGGIAILGLDGKLAGAAAITRTERVGATVRCSLLDGGRLRVWTRGTPTATDLAGAQLPAQPAGDGAWLIEVTAGGPVSVDLIVR